MQTHSSPFLTTGDLSCRGMAMCDETGSLNSNDHVARVLEAINTWNALFNAWYSPLANMRRKLKNKKVTKRSL